LFHGTRGEDFSTLGGELIILSLADASVQTIPLPPQLFPTGSVVTDLAISPDRRYLAVASQMLAVEQANPVVALDLQGDTCCITLPAPLADVAAYDLGEFYSDSHQLALSWVGFTDRANYAVTGGITIASVPNGLSILDVSMEQIAALFSMGYIPTWVLMGEWDDQGIRLHPNCWGCEPAFEGEWLLWDPDSNFIRDSTAEFFSFPFGDMLYQTGEILYAGQSAQFPVSQEPAYLPIPNVIYYVRDAPMPRFTETSSAPVIYFNENQLDISGGAHWVLDGQAVLVSPYMSDQWTLLFRDGTRQAVSVPVNSTFLRGTPNGWLSLNDDPGGVALTLYTVEGAEALATPLGITLPENQYVQVLDAPELGASVTNLGTFPTVQPLFPPISASGTCSNLLPTRLTVNTTARVTPGDPNRLRADPTTEGAIIGEIPGGAEFFILQGPICDDANRIVWWQVGYNNLIGWTAESQGDSYFVEPVGVG
jgi:hypothetical protein